MSKRILLILFFIGFILFYYAYILPPKESVQEGEIAPDFNLPQINGERLRLSDLEGEMILLNFWATWCPPCLMEMPSLDWLHRKLSQDHFKVIAISVDEGGWPQIREFLAKVPVSFPILLDRSTDVAALYGAYVLPESYLVSPNGTVIKIYRGPKEWDEKGMVDQIRKIMSEYGADREAP